MDKVFLELGHNSVCIYLDDIVVFGPTLQEHNIRLVKALLCLRKANLTLNPKKCAWAFQRIKLLGHIVDPYGIHPDPNKIAAITSLSSPTAVKQLRGFLGCVNYFRRFLKDFSLHTRVLTDLL
jgi:hypothetical protein